MLSASFIQNYTQVIAGIRLCVEKGLLSPALIIIYSTMDSYAWAVSEKSTASGRIQFEAFVSSYLLPNHPLPCTSTDLYAARCAILHTLTSQSDLSIKGKAKTIEYAWGDTETTSHATIGGGAQLGMLTLHIEDLANALFDAILAVHEKARIDSNISVRLAAAGSLHYNNLEKRTPTEFVNLIGNRD